MATTLRHDTFRERLTIRYTDAGDGWVTAQIDEEPAAISQGRTREEAYANVIDALHDLRHAPSVAERIAYTIEARVVEPVAALLHRPLAR
jgi:hypothetical protein